MRCQRRIRLWIPVLAAAAAMTITALLVGLFMIRSGRYRLEEDGWIYDYGDEYCLKEGTVLIPDEAGRYAHVGQEDSGRVVDAVPIYLGEEKERFLMPVTMIYKEPRSWVYGSLPALTTVERQKGPYLAGKGGRTVSLNKGFLFDGGNVYIFLEPMTIEFNSMERQIPAMSFVKAVPGGQIGIFNYDTKEFLCEDLKGEARATCYDYKLSLTGDCLLRAEGEKELLFSRPSVLDSLMEGLD